MKVKFKNIYIENFCSIKQLDAPLYERTVISGQNGVGKSTIRNAIFWVLFNKMADGSTPDKIRTHDENGVDIDFIDITVVLTLDVEGKEIELKKVQKQKWTKPHGKQEKRFDGNVNKFEINSISKKEKEYKNYIEKILPIEEFSFCMNASYLISQDVKKRREKLLSLESDFSEKNVIALDEKYKPIAPMLEDGTIEELIARSKKIIKKANDSKKEISIRIDELEKKKEDIDVAELELLKNSLKEQIAENQDKQSDISKQFEEYQKSYENLTELKFKLYKMQNDANHELDVKREEIRQEIYVTEHKLSEAEEKALNVSNIIKSKEVRIKNAEYEIEKYRREWKSLNSQLTEEQEREFDENSLVCSYCGQEYTDEKKEELRSEFESHKTEEINEIKGKMAEVTEIGNSLKVGIEKQKEKLEKLNDSIKEHSDEESNLRENIKGLESSLADIPDAIDISDREDVKKLQQEISKKESAMSKDDTAEEIRKSLKLEEGSLQDQLTDVEKQIAKADTSKSDSRIEQLEEEFKRYENSANAEEKTLDLLEDFNRAKVSMLTDGINSHFDLVKWKMFKQQINGGYQECCNPTVNGSSYYGLLNCGHRILAEIDICRAFQKINGITCPIIVDNAESVDDWLIPDTESQLILIGHDKTVDKLTIKESED